MERTESTVVSIAPALENDKIAEMAVFGWNLQGRQEVLGHLREAETPDNLGAAMLRGAFEGATSTKTVEYDHYVKLHFARSFALSNLERVRALEAEYRALPFRAAPKLTAPGLLIAFFGFGFFTSLSALGDPKSPGLFGVVMSAVFVAVGIYWLRARLKSRGLAEATNRGSLQRMATIRQEAEAALSSAS